MNHLYIFRTDGARLDEIPEVEIPPEKIGADPPDSPNMARLALDEDLRDAQIPRVVWGVPGLGEHLLEGGRNRFDSDSVRVYGSPYGLPYLFAGHEPHSARLNR